MQSILADLSKQKVDKHQRDEKKPTVEIKAACKEIQPVKVRLQEQKPETLQFMKIKRGLGVEKDTMRGVQGSSGLWKSSKSSSLET